MKKDIFEYVKTIPEVEQQKLNGILTECLERAKELRKMREDYEEFKKQLGLREALNRLGKTLEQYEKKFIDCERNTA